MPMSVVDPMHKLLLVLGVTYEQFLYCCCKKLDTNILATLVYSLKSNIAAS